MHYRAQGLQTYLRWRVRNQERRTSSSGVPLFQAALLRQAGLFGSGEKIFRATYETAMVIRKQNIQNQEEGKCRGPLTAPKRMVTIPGELNMDHLKFHIILESGKKM